MSEERNYCNILDLLEKDGQSDLVVLIARLCMTSLMANKQKTKDGKMVAKTFLLPPSSDVKKLMKMDAEDAKEIIKRHLFLNVHPMEKLAERNGKQLYNFIGEEYDISADGEDDIKIGKIKITGEIKGGTNGIVLKINKLLPAGKKTEKSKKSKKSKKEEDMEGGSEFEEFEEIDEFAPYGGGLMFGGKKHENFGGGNKNMKGGDWYIMNHPILNDDIAIVSDLSGLSGINLRWNIIEAYRNKWPLTLYPYDSDYHYYSWLYASLIMFLQENYPSFLTIYEPPMDPIIGTEQLLQFRWRNSSNYLLSDDWLRKWYLSSYWLSADPIILEKYNNYIIYGGNGFFDENKTGSAMKQYIRGSNMESEYLTPFVKATVKVLNDPEMQEQDKRLYIVNKYKEIEMDDNFRYPKNKKLYQKVGKDYWYLVPAALQLQAFFVTKYLNPLSNVSLFGGSLEKFKQHGGIGAPTKYNLTKFDEFMCGFFSGGNFKDTVYDILQPNESREYRFKLELLNEFCNSPFYLCSMSTLKKSFKNYYISRSPYNTVGSIMTGGALPQNFIGDDGSEPQSIPQKIANFIGEVEIPIVEENKYATELGSKSLANNISRLAAEI